MKYRFESLEARRVLASSASLFIDLADGLESSNPTELTRFGDYVYFSAETPELGRELWRTDGTPDGTQLVADLNPGLASADVHELTVWNGSLYFVADDGLRGSELWRTNGTEAGTERIADILLGGLGSSPHRLTPGLAGLMFIATTEAPGSPRVVLMSFDHSWREFGNGNDVVFISAYKNGFVYSRAGGLWNGSRAIGNALFAGGFSDQTIVLDGDLITSSLGFGQMRVRDFELAQGFRVPWRNDISQLIEHNGEAAFVAKNDSIGHEIWVGDMTAEGTELLRDIIPGPEDADIQHLTSTGDHLFFTADTPGTGREVWVSDLTERGTRMLRDIVPGEEGSNPSGFWHVDGTTYFNAANSLWQTDGTADGTTSFSDLVNSTAEFVRIGDVILFAGTSDGNGRELWQLADEPPAVLGDVTGDNQVDIADIDRLCMEVNSGGTSAVFDLDGNGTVSLADLDKLIRDIMNIPVGDSNLDGRFDSGDLVQVFTVGEYEDLLEDNSSWISGDWNCDREFDTADLVRAFEAGSFQNNAVQIAAAFATDNTTKLSKERYGHR